MSRPPGGRGSLMDDRVSEMSLADGRQFLRHCVATLAYRGGKALRAAPDRFEQFRISETTRSSGEILAHIGDILDWALSLASGHPRWHDSPRWTPVSPPTPS